MDQKKSILIIDDHPVFRAGLKAVIELDNRFEVVGEAENARQGLRMSRKYQPDIIVMAISLPDKSGIELTREIRNLSSKTQVLIVSTHSKLYYVAEAFQAGAKGYVVKVSAAEEILKGLESVAKGKFFLGSSIFPEVVDSLIHFPVKAPKIKDSGHELLTPREQEILRLLAEGLSARKIAEKLCISRRTVDNHRTHIMKKLGLHNTLDLVRYAARIGLIDLDLWQEQTH